jgi:hypothetical protein
MILDLSETRNAALLGRRKVNELMARDHSEGDKLARSRLTANSSLFELEMPVQNSPICECALSDRQKLPTGSPAAFSQQSGPARKKSELLSQT